jgi:CheY-like chemotaxis protein
MNNPTGQGKKKLLQLLILLVVALALILGCLYPLRQLVLKDIESEMFVLHERVTHKLQLAQPAIIPSLLEAFSKPTLLAALADDKPDILVRELDAFKLLEPRLNSAFWLGSDGNQKTNLLGREKNSSKKLQSFYTSLILRAYQIPNGHSLMEMVATDNQQLSLIFLHNLRNSHDINLGIILLEFKLVNVLSELQTLEASNSAFSVLLLDRYSHIISTMGDSENAGMTREEVIRQLDSFEIDSNVNVNGAVWYKKPIAPFYSELTDIYDKVDWQLLIRMSEEQLNKKLLQAYAFPLLTISGAVAMLAWFVFQGIFSGFRRTQQLATSVNGQRTILPEKMYEWVYEGFEEHTIHAPTMLMSLGYDFSRVNIFDNKLLETLVSEEDLQRLAQIEKDLHSGSELQFDIDLRLRHKLGYWVWFNIRGRVEARDKQGKILQIRGLSLDITKRKQDEKMILNALQEADQANQLKSEFIANISHEVRTPINAILGYLQLMQGGADQEGYLNKSRDAINVLLARFNQIVVYSQLEHGALEFDLQPLQLTDLIDDIIAEIKDQQLAGACTFNTSIDSTLAQWYLFDAESFRLLINLLVRTIVALGEIEQLTFVVINSGRTKRAHTLQFELRVTCDERLVSRLNAVVTNSKEHAGHLELGGSNIDLALARKLLERMNADLHVENVTGGTALVFSTDVNIPDVYHRKQINQQIIVEKNSRHDLSFDVKGSRVLIVEDNATNREVITQILGKMGVKVESVENGAIAVEKLRNDPAFHLVFMDLQMPVMDGLEATRMIRKELGLKDIPIVAVTANQFNIDREQAVEAGMDDFIPKPVNSEQLRKAIIKWVSGDRPHADLRPSTVTLLEPSATSLPIDKNTHPINPDASMKRMGGDTDMLQRIYMRFASDFKPWDSQLNDMLAQQRWVEAKMHAHTLKGAAGNIDAVVLSQLAADMEKCLAVKDVDLEKIQVLRSALSKSHEQVELAIQSYLAEHKIDEVHDALDEAAMTELFVEFADLLHRRKRLPQDSIDKLLTTLAGSPREETLKAFIEAWRSFDFNAAQNALALLSGNPSEKPAKQEPAE